MSTAISRAGQKWKEFMGSKKTHDIKLEDKKAEVNELDGYLRMAARAFTSIAQLHSQLQLYMTQLGQIVAKVYEHETAMNKEIGQKLTNMFQSIAEIQQKKIEKLALSVNYFKEWFSTIDQLKILFTRYDDDRLVYDHYKMKTEELQKTEAKGGKYQERYQRNVNKLSNANTQFQKITKEIYFKMTTILNKRFYMMNSAVSELISEEYEIFSDSAKFIKPNLQFVQKFKDNNLENQVANDEEDDDEFIKETKKKLNLQKLRDKQIVQQQQQIPEKQEIRKKQSQLINDFDTPTPDPDQPQSQIKDQKPQIQQQQQDIVRKRQVLSNPFNDEDAQYYTQQQPRQSQQSQQSNSSFYRQSYQTQNNPFQDDDQEQQQYEFQKQPNNPFDMDSDSNSLPQNMPSSMFGQQQVYYQQNAQLQQQYRQYQTHNPFLQQQQAQQNNPFQEQKQQNNPFL